MPATLDDGTRNDSDPTVPPEIRLLGLDAEALYRGVRVRLALAESPVQIGRYQLQAEIGAGGMGCVYRAWDPILDRAVAIKVIRAQALVSSEALRARLVREAELLAKFQHPNVVTIHDSGEHLGEVFLAMAYVEGHNLRDWQQQPERSLTAKVQAYIDAGRGLAAAHARDIVHRDFKPENVLIDGEGQVVVGDFGLARGADPSSSAPPGSEAAAREGQAASVGFGTLAYAAPEQLRGQAADASSDQFSFCVSLWEAIAGQRPYQAASVSAALAALDAPPQGREALPRWLRRVLERGLAQRPEDRYPDIDALLAALERGLSRRERLIRNGALVVALLLAVVGIVPEILESAVRQCPALDTIAALRDSPAIREPATRGQVQLARRLDQLAETAERACETGDAAALQHVMRWLEPTAAALRRRPSDPDELARVARWLAHTRYDHPPPSPMSAAVFDALVEAKQAELGGELGPGLAAAERAVAAASTDVDRTEALLQRGRLRTLSGDYQLALSDYDHARYAAIRAGFGDGQLRARLLSARTRWFRLRDHRATANDVREAEASLVFLREPLLSPRRAEIAELSAALAGHDDDPQVALRGQLLALGQSWISGRSSQWLARATTNLGNILSWDFDRPLMAAASYRLALAMDPNCHSARLALVHLINEQPRELNELELAYVPRAIARLLADAEHHDLLVQVRTEQLNFVYRTSDDPQQLDAAIERVFEALDDPRQAHPPDIVANASRWLTVALAQRAHFDHRYDDAVRRWAASQTEAPSSLARASWEAVALDLAAAAHPVPVRAQYVRLLAELASLDPSEARDELVQHLQDSLARE